MECSHEIDQTTLSTQNTQKGALEMSVTFCPGTVKYKAAIHQRSRDRQQTLPDRAQVQQTLKSYAMIKTLEEQMCLKRLTMASLQCSRTYPSGKQLPKQHAELEPHFVH